MAALVFTLFMIVYALSAFATVGKLLTSESTSDRVTSFVTLIFVIFSVLGIIYLYTH